MLAAHLFVTAVGMAFFVGIVWSASWIANRWLHRIAAFGIGALASIWLAQNIVRGIFHCLHAPRYVPPAPGEGGEGQMIFNCDSAGGVIDRVYLYVIGPLALITLILISVRFLRAKPVVNAP
ncbi:hypothetical protein [Primorskyibacter flagellatus]|uniref:Uncharacterized protein n=1 Tax=Primorskyibacter flagellatus TaxID=1387277 RepID=A0A1W2AU79_9RHOB|nr:hypothetical protein [Primorskyibacter flagellatus]SMC64287.1 hypothetical protein SAMN06295998_103295 [Primorskyibacter flagellatus]